MLKDMAIGHVEGCLFNEKRINKISERLDKIENDERDFQKEVLEEMKELSFKLDEMYNKYEPLLEAVLIEFANHRKGISYILKGLGYPVDEIRGWDVNNWDEKENGRNSRKSKGILRRSRKKEKGNRTENSDIARRDENKIRKKFLKKRKREEKNKRKRGKKKNE